MHSPTAVCNAASLLRRSFFLLLTVLGLFFLPGGASADPLSEMKAFSGIQGADLASLEGGKTVVGRGGSMSSPKDLAVQSCYLVPLPLQKAVNFHRQWNAARYPELKVYMHRELSAKSSPAEFLEAFAAIRANEAVRSLAAATEALASGQSELQLSATEAKQFGKAASGGAKGPFSPQGAAFWSNLLSERALAFASGGAASQPPYAISGETVKVTDEIARLLKEQPKLRDQFKPVLDDAALASGGGKLAPALYSELVDVEGRAAFLLGASYSQPVKDGWQGVDVQYYSSNGFFALLTFYQFWPVTTASGQPATLVWRGDLISSASLAELHGVERLGSSGAMMKEIQKSIDFLQRDAAAAKR
ncbi:MAG: hypothetical protein ACFUZC_18060 [Chthoniobacteraceae bacterium]